MTFRDTHNVISSPASEAGRSPCGLPESAQIDLFGPAVALARPSASPERKRTAPSVKAEILCRALDELATSYAVTATMRGLPTPGTYGRNSGGSSPSAVLQKSLVSRLQARMDVSGSPEYELRWKSWDMQLGGADLCAAGVGAPHIRQRLWWVADSAPGGLGIDGSARRECGYADERGPDHRLAHPGSTERGRRTEPEGQLRGALYTPDGGGTLGMADAEYDGGRADKQERQEEGRIADLWDCGRLGDTDGSGRGELCRPEPMGAEQLAPERPGGFWSDAVLIPCRDGKTRRIKPGLAPLVARLPGDVGIIRAAGNSICPQVGAEFIRAYFEAKRAVTA